MQPKRDRFALRRPVNTVFRVGVALYTTSMGDPTATGRTRPLGAGGVHYACWGSQRGGVPVGGWLKPDVNMMIKADRPSRLGDDMATFENIRHIVVAYWEFDQAYAYHEPKTE